MYLRLDVPSEQPGSEGLTEPVSQERRRKLSLKAAGRSLHPAAGLGGKETQPEKMEETRRHCPTTRYFRSAKDYCGQRYPLSGGGELAGKQVPELLCLPLNRGRP